MLIDYPWRLGRSSETSPILPITTPRCRAANVARGQQCSKEGRPKKIENIRIARIKIPRTPLVICASELRASGRTARQYQPRPLGDAHRTWGNNYPRASAVSIVHAGGRRPGSCTPSIASIFLSRGEFVCLLGQSAYGIACGLRPMPRHPRWPTASFSLGRCPIHSSDGAAIFFAELFEPPADPGSRRPNHCSHGHPLVRP